MCNVMKMSYEKKYPATFLRKANKLCFEKWKYLILESLFYIVTWLNSTVRAVYQARSHGRFQPRINSHISYTKTNILIIKTHSTSNSNNNYAKFTKKYLNHYLLRKIYLGLLSLFLSSRCSIVASNYRPYHVYCRFGNLSTNRL